MFKKKPVIIILSVMLIVYAIGAILFSFRAVPNTYIGSTKISMSKIGELSTQAEEKFNAGELAIDDIVIKDYSKDFKSLGAKIDSEKLQADIKADQNAFIWPFELAAKSEYDIRDYISVDEKELEATLEKDGFFKTTGRTKSKPAKLELDKKAVSYKVIDATDGTVLDRKLFVKQVADALASYTQKIDSAESYYIANANLKELESQAKQLNERIERKVSMKIGEDTIDVPKLIIAESLIINKDGKVDVDGRGLYDFLYDESLSYDSDEVGFGYRKVIESNVDPAYEEIKAGLISDENKAIVGTAPIADDEDSFSPVVKTSNKTYIEISISHQVMWVFKNGSLLVQTPIVTGNQAEGWDTPVGDYTVISKETDKVLNGSSVGFDYKVPVNYWMRLTNSGIGIHDIDWLNTSNAWDSRNVYEFQGSHGCVNVPNDIMSTVYNNIPSGTPVYVRK